MKYTRRGFTLIEIVVATILLATLMTISLQFLVRARLQRGAVERREAALQAAGNVMQRLTALEWSELTPEAAAAVTLDDDATAATGGGSVKASVDTRQEEEIAAKRIAVEVHIPQQGGGEQAPVRLTSWVYQRPGS